MTSSRTEIEIGRHSTKSTELRKKRRNIEIWHEQEKERSRSSLMSDDSGDDIKLSKRKHKKKSKRSLKSTPEESVRKARSIMEDYDEQKEGTGHIQLALVTDIGEVLKLLEEDRQKTETRLRSVEEEAQRLKMERVASSERLSNLKASQNDAELHIKRRK
jgi:hypothetical protein